MKKSFVGIFLTSGGTAAWPKVFQAGFKELWVTSTLGPAKLVKKLKVGEPYLIDFKLKHLKETHPGTGVFTVKNGVISELNKKFRL